MAKHRQTKLAGVKVNFDPDRAVREAIDFMKKVFRQLCEEEKIPSQSTTNRRKQRPRR
jgi:hypothetical protein